MTLPERAGYHSVVFLLVAVALREGDNPTATATNINFVLGEVSRCAALCTGEDSPISGRRLKRSIVLQKLFVSSHAGQEKQFSEIFNFVAGVGHLPMAEIPPPHPPPCKSGLSQRRVSTRRLTTNIKASSGMSLSAPPCAPARTPRYRAGH